VAFQSWNTYCKFDGCRTYLLAGQGQYVCDPHPRALCDKHFAQVQQMRKNAQRKKRISRLQPQLPMEES